jgi:hypothetical protein
MGKSNPGFESPFDLGNQGCLPVDRPNSRLGYQAHGEIGAGPFSAA